MRREQRDGENHIRGELTTPVLFLRKTRQLAWSVVLFKLPEKHSHSQGRHSLQDHTVAVSAT